MSDDSKTLELGDVKFWSRVQREGVIRNAFYARSSKEERIHRGAARLKSMQMDCSTRAVKEKLRSAVMINPCIDEIVEAMVDSIDGRVACDGVEFTILPANGFSNRQRRLAALGDFVAELYDGALTQMSLIEALTFYMNLRPEDLEVMGYTNLMLVHEPFVDADGTAWQLKIVHDSNGLSLMPVLHHSQQPFTRDTSFVLRG